MSLKFEYLLEDAKTNGDVTINVGKRDAARCHSYVLHARCPALLQAKPAHKVKNVSENKKKEQVNISLNEEANHTNEALEVIMKYLYTAEIDFPRDIKSLIHVGVCAKQWNLGRLRWNAEDELRSRLDGKVIFSALTETDALQDDTLKLICVLYAIETWAEFVVGAGTNLDMKLFTEMVQTQTKPPAAPKIKDEPGESIVDDFQKLYKEKARTDAELAVGDPKKPTKFKVHRAMLAARSPQMPALFEPPKDKKKDPLTQLSPRSFETLLRFVYYGDEEIDPKSASLLVPFCQVHGLSDLQKACEDRISNNINQDTALDILNVAYDPSMSNRKALQEELKANATNYIVEELANLELTPLRRMDPHIAVDLLMACQNKARGGPPVQAKTTTRKGPEKKPEKKLTADKTPKKQISTKSPRKGTKK